MFEIVAGGWLFGTEVKFENGLDFSKLNKEFFVLSSFFSDRFWFESFKSFSFEINCSFPLSFLGTLFEEIVVIDVSGNFKLVSLSLLIDVKVDFVLKSGTIENDDVEAIY